MFSTSQLHIGPAHPAQAPLVLLSASLTKGCMVLSDGPASIMNTREYREIAQYFGRVYDSSYMEQINEATQKGLKGEDVDRPNESTATDPKNDAKQHTVSIARIARTR